MFKSEFEKLINKEITDKEYYIVEKVYMWHPLFENKYKEDVVRLYKEFGFEIFVELYQTAKEFEEFEIKIDELNKKIKDIDIKKKEYFDNKFNKIDEVRINE